MSLDTGKLITIPIFNSSSLARAYMHQQTRPLIQMMACCLFGTEPLSEPNLVYCYLDPCG